MLKDTNQNFWQLACIQSSAMGLYVMLVGKQIATTYGAGVAITSICIGNLVLWIIGLSMFSMTYKGKGDAKHAIENVLSYLGKPITFIAALVVMVAFLSWFPMQINAQMDLTERLLAQVPGWTKTIRLIISIVMASIMIGVSMLGIKAIKWACTAIFPLLVLFVLYAVFNRTVPFPEITWGVSIHGIILTIVIIFPGIINLPTFFRHARSKADGILALTLMTLFVIGFEMVTIWFQVDPSQGGVFTPFMPSEGWTANLVIVLGFVALATFCVNIVNIYFASAALEIVVPNITDTRGYALIGILGILALNFFKSEALIAAIQTVTNNFIGSLGVILVGGYLARTIITHRHRIFEKQINIFCWVVGCVTSFTLYLATREVVHSFNISIATALLAFIIIIFIEETVWSMLCIPSSKKERE